MHQTCRRPASANQDAFADALALVLDVGASVFALAIVPAAVLPLAPRADGAFPESAFTVVFADRFGTVVIDAAAARSLSGASSKSMTLPGFMMLSGSIARLIVFISATCTHLPITTAHLSRSDCPEASSQLPVRAPWTDISAQEFTRFDSCPAKNQARGTFLPMPTPCSPVHVPSIFNARSICSAGRS